MQPGDFTDIPNPFAFAVQADVGHRRRTAKGALKFLIVVVVCFTLVLGISIGSKRFLLHRLTADLENLSSAEQETRLLQLAALGPPAIEPLCDALLREDVDVARTAYDLLSGLQNDWTVLGLSEQRTRHEQLVQALQEIAIQLPDDRTGWAATLIQQTIAEVVQRTDAPSRKLFQDANATLEMLSLATRSGPSILAQRPLDPLQPRRLIVRSRPLPVGDAATTFDSDEVESMSSKQALPEEGASPSIYKSASTRLQPIAREQPVLLRDVHDDPRSISAVPAAIKTRPPPIATSYQVEQVQSSKPLVDSAMQAYDDPSVLLWLSSEHAALREQARLELVSRGYTPRELNLADRIAAADVPTRIELVNLIAHEPTIDPRPWLWMISRDEHRDVRLAVVSVMGTMDDPDARQHLRQMMVDDPDPIVAARIRRILGLR